MPHYNCNITSLSLVPQTQDGVQLPRRQGVCDGRRQVLSETVLSHGAEVDDDGSAVRGHVTGASSGLERVDGSVEDLVEVCDQPKDLPIWEPATKAPANFNIYPSRV
jgi:hypothetical protein